MITHIRILVSFLFAVNLIFAQNAGMTEYELLFSETYTLVKNNSINRQKANWNVLSADLLKRASDIDSESKFYTLVQELLDSLHDNHSYLTTHTGKRWQKIQRLFNPKYEFDDTVNLAKSGIAFIKVNPSSGDLQKDCNTLYNLIHNSYSSDMEGWILDFRNNSGGHFWSMLAALSNLIASDTAGFGIYPGGNSWKWYASEGKAGVGTNTHFKVTNAISEPFKEKPIAILLSNVTASSGEASIISFVGKPNIITIGVKSRGLATINQPFKLGNGAVIMLTTGWFGDRNKNTYPNGITPSIIENSPKKQVEKAVNWIKNYNNHL